MFQPQNAGVLYETVRVCGESVFEVLLMWLQYAFPISS